MNKLKYSVAFLTMSLLFSCGDKPTEEKNTVQDEKKVAALSLKKNYVFKDEISADVKEEIKAWDELEKLSQFLQNNYAEVSPSISLELSKELVDMSKALKDSLNIPTLNNRPFLARINVFYSEALRLNDMSQINAIKPGEVEAQLEKIKTVYNSINKKIEDIYAQRNFDKNVNFDESFFDFVKTDSSENIPQLPSVKPTKRPSVVKPTKDGKLPFRR